MLKPEKRLQWKGAVVQPLKVQPKAPPKEAPKEASLASKIPVPPRPKGLPSNAKTQSQLTIEQVQKMAVAKGIPVEKLLAQLVQQYLKEDKEAQ